MPNAETPLPSAMPLRPLQASPQLLRAPLAAIPSLLLRRGRSRCTLRASEVVLLVPRRQICLGVLGASGEKSLGCLHGHDTEESLFPAARDLASTSLQTGLSGNGVTLSPSEFPALGRACPPRPLRCLSFTSWLASCCHLAPLPCGHLGFAFILTR